MFEFLIEFLVTVLSGLGGTSPKSDSISEHLIYYGIIFVIIIILALIALTVFFDYQNSSYATT